MGPWMGHAGLLLFLEVGGDKMWTLIWQLSQLLFLGMIVYIGILVIKALKKYLNS